MYTTPYNAPFMPPMGGGYGQQAQIMPQAQFQSQPMPPMQEQRKTNAEWILVSSAQQAREHIVQPNQMLYFMNNNKSEFYAKSADNFGSTSFKAFRFEEINPDAVPAFAAQANQNSADYERMNARISALESQIRAITGGMQNEPDYANDERKPGGGNHAGTQWRNDTSGNGAAGHAE